MATGQQAPEGGADEIEIDVSEMEGGGDGGESADDQAERERAELAQLLDGEEPGDRDSKPDKGKADKVGKKVEPKKPEEKKAEGDGDGKGEGLAKNWKAYRKARDGQDAREADLKAREARLQEAEADRAARSARLTALERLAAGDVEALDELGLDFEKLTAGYLARRSGDKPRGREKDPEVESLKKRLDDEATAREREVGERQYREAATRFEAVAKDLRELRKYSPAKREALGNALAMELHEEGKKVPPPEEIARMLAKRVREDFEETRAAIEGDDDQAEAEEKPTAPAAKQQPRPISSRDRAERGGVRRPASSDDERDAERKELAKMLFGAA